MNGARAEQRCAGPATDREGVGKGAGGTRREGAKPPEKGGARYLGAPKDRPAGRWSSRLVSR